jgi:hypothetical protein
MDAQQEKAQKRKEQLRNAQKRYKEKHGLIKTAEEKEKLRQDNLQKLQEAQKETDLPKSYTLEYRQNYYRTYYEKNKEKLRERSKNRYVKKADRVDNQPENNLAPQ